MTTHLDNVDRSLEELTKKVQKHTMKSPDLINGIKIDTNESDNEEQPKKFDFSILLKPPYVFIIGLPLFFIISLLYIQPYFIMEIDKKNPLKHKKYVGFKKLMQWTIAMSCVFGACIYYFIYVKKNDSEN